MEAKGWLCGCVALLSALSMMLMVTGRAAAAEIKKGDERWVCERLDANDNCLGKVTIHYANGDVFASKIVPTSDGGTRYSGPMTQVWANGARMECASTYSTARLCEGNTVVMAPDGKKWTGTNKVKEGKSVWVGALLAEFPDGSREQCVAAEVEVSFCNGPTTLTLPTGEKLVGTRRYENGNHEWTGSSVNTWPDGMVVHCEKVLANGRCNGRGRIVDADGEERVALFENGIEMEDAADEIVQKPAAPSIASLVIVSTEPGLSSTLSPGQTFKVKVRYNNPNESAVNIWAYLTKAEKTGKTSDGYFYPSSNSYGKGSGELEMSFSLNSGGSVDEIEITMDKINPSKTLATARFPVQLTWLGSGVPSAFQNEPNLSDRAMRGNAAAPVSAAPAPAYDGQAETRAAERRAVGEEERRIEREDRRQQAEFDRRKQEDYTCRANADICRSKCSTNANIAGIASQLMVFGAAGRVAGHADVQRAQRDAVANSISQCTPQCDSNLSSCLVGIR